MGNVFNKKEAIRTDGLFLLVFKPDYLRTMRITFVNSPLLTLTE